MENEKSQKVMKWLLACFILFLADVGASAQNLREIQGKVLDATFDEPLIGVSILEKGSINGVISDFDGNFILKVQPNSVTVFSYVGYLFRKSQLKSHQIMGSMRIKGLF